MALPILDGNQTAATLSTVLTGGEHIPAHTVVSLGSQAITDVRSAVSGSVVSISNFPASQSTTFGAVTGSVSVLNFPSTQTVAGTVTANIENASVTFFGDGNDSLYSVLVNTNLNVNLRDPDNGQAPIGVSANPLPISGTVTANVPMVSNQPTGQGQAIPVILITDEGKSVFDVNQSLPVSGAFYQATQPVSIASLPASTVTVSSLPSVTISSLPAISGTVTIGAVSTSVTVSQIQGTSVTTSNFTSTTASQTLVSANSARRGLTVFNEGAGNLHICAGATATTVAYQVRLLAGDYWECPTWQTSLTHSAQFATSGTARVVEII